MFQELLPLLPKESGAAALAATVPAGTAGLVLWFAGARYSRMYVTLVTVFLGATMGMILPRALGWDVNTMATSLTGALVLGFAGFVLHRVWVGVGLALVLALWAALGTWAMTTNYASIDWPKHPGTVKRFAKEFWERVPDEAKRPLPLTVGLAAASGLVLSILWPRMATVLLYSLCGVTLIVGAGLCAIEARTVQWPRFLPAKTDMQVALLAGMVVMGAMVQWHWTMKKRRPASQPQE